MICFYEKNEKKKDKKKKSFLNEKKVYILKGRNFTTYILFPRKREKKIQGREFLCDTEASFLLRGLPHFIIIFPAAKLWHFINTFRC